MNHLLNNIASDFLFTIILPWGMVDLVYLFVCVVRELGLEDSHTDEGMDRHFPSVHNATLED